MEEKSSLVQNEEKEVLNVLPLGKGKRILLFLSDFFLNFILGFLLFMVAVLPIGKGVTNYSNRNNGYITNCTERGEILYGTQLLFDSGKVEKSQIVYNTSYTYYVYLSYYVIDEVNPTNVEFKQYGHKEENEIFRHYFNDIAQKHDDFIRLFDLYNATDNYFERVDNVITLKEEYKNQIAAYFDTSDKESEIADQYMENIEKHLFYPMFSEVMTMIDKTDLVYNGLSYKDIQQKIQAFEKYVNSLAVVTGIVTVVLSTGILYLLIPMLNKNHKTLSMMIMKVERVNLQSLDIIKKPALIISFVYALFTNLIISFFVPMGFLTFYEVFNLPILMTFGILSLVLQIGSMIFLFINQYNMTMFDYFVRCVYLKTETLDDIYRAKGYYI